jgi:NADPH:quinone reductase
MRRKTCASASSSSPRTRRGRRLDPVGGDYTEAVLRTVAWGGRFAELEPQRYRQLLDELMGWLAEGRVRPAVTARRPLDQAAEALKDVAERRVRGKTVLLTHAGMHSG